MKHVLLHIFIFLLAINISFAQCGASTACNPNTGILSNNSATDIAYDNMGSAFHSTYIKEESGIWKVWGEVMANDGATNVLNPLEFNAPNYPALTGTIYKMAIGSDGGIQGCQLLVLTSTGLFALGFEGKVLSTTITTSSIFQKITINGQLNGLPVGINPEDVKMLFASTNSLIITTCNGEVYVLSQYINIRGNNATGFDNVWSQVMENATTPITNVNLTRGNGNTAFALKNDGTLWTWGQNTYLGNGTASATRNYATQMTLPPGIAGVKMIQATLDSLNPSYYVLASDAKLYTLGRNNHGQLGDRTFLERTSWVNAKNPNNTEITDAAWISSNEHDKNFDGIAVIKSNGTIYTSGYNSNYMIGRTITSNVNFLDRPNGIAATDFVTFAEVGGHTCALIKQCNSKYGYVGHRINGSMGEGTNAGVTTQNYDFSTPPVINVCGAAFVAPTVALNSANICNGENGIFTITGLSGQIVTYNLNNGTSQNITLNASGIGVVIVNNPTNNQTLNLTQITSNTCVIPLTNTDTIAVGAVIAPNFNQVAPICSGTTLAALPTTSSNGIIGTWSPALNNTVTTTYTFNPNAGQCAGPNTMTIAVNNPSTLPTFNAIAPICAGNTILPLPTTSSNGVAGTWSPALNNLSTTSYTFTPTAGQCSLNGNITITVNPNVAPTFAAVAPINAGSSLSPLPTTSLNGVTGSWAPPLNNLATTTYTFTPNSGQCATPTTLQIVVIVPLVIPTFNQILPICSGTFLAELPKTSLNGIIGTWSPVINNLATTTYTFVPNAGQNADNATMTVVVNQRITPTFNAVNAICEGGTLSALPTTSINGITGSWSPVLNNLATTTYTFSPATGLCANNQTLTIVVNPILTPNFTQVSDICINGTLLALPTTSLNGITGIWSPALNNQVTTTYTFTPTTSLCVNNQIMTIVVNPIVTPTFNSVATICSGTVVSALPTISLNGVTGNWSPALNNSATTTYTFTPTTGLCANTQTLIINVTPSITPIFSNIADICYNGIAPSLPIISNNGISGTWSPNTISTIASGIYNFIPSGSICTNAAAPLNVTVFNDLDYIIQSQCVGENYVYEIASQNNSFDVNTATIVWRDSNNAIIANNSQVLDFTNYLKLNNIQPNFPITISVNVTSANGCTKKKDILIENIYCGIQKGISPNSDNLNDFFDLQLLDVRLLKIYNRYGMIVYSKAAYTNEWAGQSDNGQQLPDGTYYYVIDFDNNNNSRVGWIYINREIK